MRCKLQIPTQDALLGISPPRWSPNPVKLLLKGQLLCIVLPGVHENLSLGRHRRHRVCVPGTVPFLSPDTHTVHSASQAS